MLVIGHVQTPCGRVIDADATARLHGVLVGTVAMARWGSTGFYRAAALLDPAVEAAVNAFDHAASILGRQPE